MNALPALHLQPSFKSVPSGVRTKKDTTVEAPTAEVGPAADLAPRNSSGPPNPNRPREPGNSRGPQLTHEAQPTQETHDKSGVDFAAVAELCTRLARALDVCDVTPVLDEAAQSTARFSIRSCGSVTATAAN